MQNKDHYFSYIHSCSTNTVETILSSQPRDKPKVAAYDIWLLNTDQYFLQPELLKSGHNKVGWLPKIKQKERKTSDSIDENLL